MSDTAMESRTTTWTAARTARSAPGGARPAPSAPRRALLAGGAALALLGALTACDDEKGPAVRAGDDLGDLPTRIEPGAVAPLTPEDPRGLACSLTRVVLTGGEQLRALAPDRVSELTGGSAPEEPLEAPEGEGYLLVALEGEEPLWVTQTFTEPPICRVIVRRPDGEETFPVPVDRVRSGMLLRTVADPAPEDAVLELTELGRTQRLSLVDGTLLHTDLPDLGSRTVLDGEDWFGAGTELVGTQDPAAQREEATDPAGGRDRVTLQAMYGATAPLDPVLGWASEGAQFLLVVVQAFQTHRAQPDAEQILLPMDLSGSRLVLPGGEEREVLVVRDEMHAPPGRSAGTDIQLWFEIPLDLVSAEVHVAATPFPRREGLAEELAASCAMTIPLSFEAWS